MAKTGIKVMASLAGTKAKILISSVIAEHDEISASGIRNMVDEFITQGITEADIYINSKGGDAFEATEIDSHLERFNTVTFYIGSVAASAATYLTSNPKFRVVAKYNSQLMIHRPILSAFGDIDKIKAAIKLLENTTALYRSRYSAKTGMPAQEIDNLWAKGDYWMSAEEARDKGFVDEVLGYKSAMQIDNEETAIAAMASVIPAPAPLPGIRANWTLEDYLEKDPEALKVISRTSPALFDQLNTGYFNNNITAKKENNPETSDDRSKWTLEDYIGKDPESLKEMARKDTEQFRKLNEEYMNRDTEK